MLPQEIACVDITPIVGDTAELCMLGLWVDMSVHILRFPSLEELHKVKLEEEKKVCEKFF